MRIIPLALILCAHFSACAENEKYRVVIMTDMTHDDGNSLIRYMYYSHLFDTEAIIVTPQLPDYDYNSEQPWEKGQAILDAYDSEFPQLRKHNPEFPTPDSIRAVTKKGRGALPIIWLTNTGHFEGGIAGRHVTSQWGDIRFDDWIGEGLNPNGESKDSEGSRFLQTVFEKDDDRPIFVQMWGGPITFIQALYRYQQNHTEQELQTLLDKLHLYGILLQDITFDYLVDLDLVKAKDCTNFGSTTSTFDGERLEVGWLLHDGGHFWQYCCSGDENWKKPMHENDVIGHGPMSNLYDHGGEGDTPAFLYLISAHYGLNDPLEPEHGSWGGMFSAMGEVFPEGYYDTCGVDVDQLMRWQFEVRNSFLNRLNYSLKHPDEVNHEPVGVINGDDSYDILRLTVDSGEVVELDASTSYDPDGGPVDLQWNFYTESSSYTGKLDWESTSTGKVKVRVPDEIKSREIHLVLEVRDRGSPSLTTYRRVILQGTPKTNR